MPDPVFDEPQAPQRAAQAAASSHAARPAMSTAGPAPASTRPNTGGVAPYAHLLAPTASGAQAIPESAFETDNSTDNPWARPMTKEVAEQHEHAKSLMGQLGIPEQYHENTIRTGMPGTFEIGERKAGDVTHSRKSVEAAHGRYTSPVEVSREQSVQGHALAWMGQGASREDQHGQASSWIHGSDTATPILRSIAAPQVHRATGEVLPGGLPQEFQPRGFLQSGVVKKSIVDKMMAGTRAKRAAAEQDTGN
ncbi:MAG: hypothetical protein ACKOW5_07260 [Actinomycetales bacterium]